MADLLVNRAYNVMLRRSLRWNRMGVEVALAFDWERLSRILDGGGRFRDAFERIQPDAVVFCTPWLLAPAARSLPPGIPCFSVVLDLAPPLSPGWEAADHAMVATRDALEGLGTAGEVVGAPVFLPTGESATPRCAKCSDRPHLLLMGGGEGLAGTRSLAKELVKERAHVTALAGSSTRLLRELRSLSDRGEGHIEARPFVRDVIPLIAGHDVIVTKPGALTVCEAIAHQKPLLLDARGGLMAQEKGNADYVVRERAGSIIRRSGEARTALSELLGDPGKRDTATRANALAGAERIAARVLAVVQ